MPMKTIHIFFASSAELEDDRNALGNLVRRLNKVYARRGIYLDLYEWEDEDASYNGRRKQDEYNEKIRISDMFLAAFHRNAGQYTIEEFNVAAEERKSRDLPKIYVYCKALGDGDVETAELADFKRHLSKELGHYFSNYSNRDTMQLHFVMQLQLVESSMCDELKVENGCVTLDELNIARMDRLPFAGLNEEFQRMSKRLAELPAEIENHRRLIEQMPGQKFLQSKLQQLMDEYNALNETFAEYQMSLLKTAKRVAQLQGALITDRLRRAIDAFNSGKVREANIILDEAERDGQLALERYRATKEVVEEERQNVIRSIEEILFKTSTILADVSMDIADRITMVEKLYEQADVMAAEVEYDADKYDELLSNYAEFLAAYAKYDKALEIYKRLIDIGESLYGAEHPYTASVYNNIGLVYNNLGRYANSLEYFARALNIFEATLGTNHPHTANAYNNIGIVYDVLGQYDGALGYYVKGLEIRKQVLGDWHTDVAMSYNNIGIVYDTIGNYDNALKCHLRALEIYKRNYGEEHPHTATSYNNIGNVYNNLEQYDQALEYYTKGLEIRKSVLGEESPEAASSYDNIGLVYNYLGQYDKSLGYHSRALEIREDVLGLENPDTALTYNNIGFVYSHLGEYDKSFTYFLKAAHIYEVTLGPKAPDTAMSYNNIGGAYYYRDEKDKALEYLTKAYEIWSSTLGEDHHYTKQAKGNIESIKAEIEDR